MQQSQVDHPRHFATAEAWKWLEQGEGRLRPEESQVAIRKILHQLDADLFDLDSWKVEPETQNSEL